jgi:hypothetical protein
LFALHPDVFKIAAVPYRTQIALQSGFVVNIAFAAVNAGLDRLRGDAAVAGDVNVFNDLASLRCGKDFWSLSKEQ